VALSIPLRRNRAAPSPYAGLSWSGTKNKHSGLAVLGGVLALLAALAPPIVTIGALAGILLSLLLMARPVMAVYLLVFCVPYESVRDVPLGALHLTLTEFVAFFGGAAFLASAARQGRVRVSEASWAGPLFLFAGVMVLSMSQATDLTSSIKEFLKLGEEVLTYLLVLAYIDTPARVKRLVGLLVFAAASQALLGVLQTFAHFGPASFLRVGGLLRADGTFDQPNPYAGYLNYTLPLLIAAVALRVDLIGKWTKPSLVLIAAAMLLSQSRGALIAIIVALAVILIVAQPRVRALVGAAGALVVGLVVAAIFGIVPSSVTGTLADAVGLGNVDLYAPTPLTWAAAERLAHQLAGLAMFGDHPILGVGIGNYPAAYPKYQLASYWGPPLGHAHNYYINVAAEAGVVGLGAFLVVLVSAFIIGVKLYRRAETPRNRVLALGMIGVLTALTVHNNFDDVFVHAMEAQLALVVGLATVSCRLDDDGPAIVGAPAPRGLGRESVIQNG